MIAAYTLVQAEAGQAAMVAAAPRICRGVAETASPAGPCDVTARARAHHTGELARLVTSRVQAPAA
jgi:hypothetical protein